MDSNPAAVFFQFVPTSDARGSCDKRFSRLTLYGKAGRPSGRKSSGNERAEPGRGTFFGWTPKKAHSVCSGVPPSARGLGPSPPAPLPQGARGERVRRVGGNAAVRRLPSGPVPSSDFFWVDPKKVTLFQRPKKPKKSSLLVAGGPDLVIPRLFELRQEGAGLRQIGVEAQRLFEFRVGFHRSLVGCQDHSEVRVGRGRAEDF